MWSNENDYFNSLNLKQNQELLNVRYHSSHFQLWRDDAQSATLLGKDVQHVNDFPIEKPLGEYKKHALIVLITSEADGWRMNSSIGEVNKFCDLVQRNNKQNNKDMDQGSDGENGHF